MSLVSPFHNIDQALLELAINNSDRLYSLKKRYLEFIEIVDRKLKNQYSYFDQIYLQSRNSFPVFEKDLLELENIKINSENIIKKIEKILQENSQASTSASILDIPD